MVWSLFAPKINYCLTINKFGFIDEHKIFESFTNVSDILNRKQSFNMADGGKLIAKISLSWKKSFSQGVVVPHKIKTCSVCKNDILCDICDKLVNKKKNSRLISMK